MFQCMNLLSKQSNEQSRIVCPRSRPCPSTRLTLELLNFGAFSFFKHSNSFISTAAHFGCRRGSAPPLLLVRLFFLRLQKGYGGAASQCCAVQNSLFSRLCQAKFQTSLAAPIVKATRIRFFRLSTFRTYYTHTHTHNRIYSLTLASLAPLLHCAHSFSTDSLLTHTHTHHHHTVCLARHSCPATLLLFSLSSPSDPCPIYEDNKKKTNTIETV